MKSSILAAISGRARIDGAGLLPVRPCESGDPDQRVFKAQLDSRLRGNERNEVRNYFRSSPRKRGPRAKAEGVNAIFPGLDSRLRGNERNEVRNYFRSSPRKRGPRAKPKGV